MSVTNSTPRKECQKCTEPINEQAERCPYCGYEEQKWRKIFRLDDPYGNCASCGERIKEKETTCPECGFRRSVPRILLGISCIFFGLFLCLPIITIPVGLLFIIIGHHLRTPVGVDYGDLE